MKYVPTRWYLWSRIFTQDCFIIKVYFYTIMHVLIITIINIISTYIRTDAGPTFGLRGFGPWFLPGPSASSAIRNFSPLKTHHRTRYFKDGVFHLNFEKLKEGKSTESTILYLRCHRLNYKDTMVSILLVHVLFHLQKYANAR